MFIRAFGGVFLGAALASAWWAWALWGRRGTAPVSPETMFVFGATAIFFICMVVVALADMVGPQNLGFTLGTGEGEDEDG